MVLFALRPEPCCGRKHAHRADCQSGALLIMQLKRDGLYVEGTIKVGGTGPPICFSSNQALALMTCAAASG